MSLGGGAEEKLLFVFLLREFLVRGGFCFRLLTPSQKKRGKKKTHSDVELPAAVEPTVIIDEGCGGPPPPSFAAEEDIPGTDVGGGASGPAPSGGGAPRSRQHLSSSSK